MLPSDLGYSADDLARVWEAGNPRFLIGLFVGSLCFYIYYFEGVRCGLRDKCAGIPWQTNMFNVGHDSIYVLSFASWFTPGLATNQFLTQAMWYGILFWLAMEMVVHYQTLKWSRDELFPMLKDRSKFVAVYLFCQAFIWLLVMWLKVTLDDPTFYILIAMTYTACLLFNFHFLHRRGSRRGQSRALVWALALTPLAWWFMVLPSVSPNFDNVWTYLFGVANCVLSFGYALYYESFPKQQPA
jgi:hypothetical protein